MNEMSNRLMFDRAAADQEYQNRYCAHMVDLYREGLSSSLIMLEWGQEFHNFDRNGQPQYRKDDVSRAYIHQLDINEGLFKLRRMIYDGGFSPDLVIAAAHGHDLIEEDLAQLPELRRLSRDLWMEKLRGRPDAEEIFRIDLLLSKFREDGGRLTTHEQYPMIFDDPVAGIIKLADRKNNVETIAGLPPLKQPRYVIGTRHLLAESERLTAKFPETAAVAYLYKRGIEAALDRHLLRVASLAKDGQGDEVVRAFVAAKLLPYQVQAGPAPKRERAAPKRRLATNAAAI